MTSAKTVTETTFTKTVLAARIPMLVLFGTRACPATPVLRQLLIQRIEFMSGPIGIAQVDIERCPLLAEHYGVMSTPTLLLFGGGDVITRIVGFVPQGLLHALIDHMCQEQVPSEPYWQPLETLVEDTVILPLLDSAGLCYQRQVACRLPKNSAQQRGRIDVLVYDDLDQRPFTLIESKRLLRTERHLQQAARQGLAYAQALELPSFAVADPSGFWFFRRDGARALLEQTLSSLDIHRTPQLAAAAFQRLRRYQA